MEIHKSCSVFGHFQIDKSDNLSQKLEDVFCDLIESKGVGIFYFGGFGQFDDLCYNIISKLKAKYTHIKRVFCLSDPKHENPINRPKWLNDEQYEEYIYLTLKFDYWYTRIYYRNCEIINQSDYCVFYIRETEKSGAYKTYQYAKKQHKQILGI